MTTRTHPAGTRPPVLIIGGGPAGAAAACRLAAQHIPVAVAERSTAPHDTICGEFLSIEAQTALASLGIDPKTLGAEPIDTLRLVHRRRTADIPLPFTGQSLSRRILDEALLARAKSLGATIRRGETMRALPQAAPGPIVLATGKHALRGAPRRTRPGDMIGFKMYFRLTPPAAQRVAGHVEIHLFANGYAGFEPVEGNRANLCLLISQKRFSTLRTWPALLDWLCNENIHLAEHLSGAIPLLENPLTIARVPYGFIHQPAVADPENLYRVGDQMAVIPSFCGDGLAIALHTGLAAAAAIAAGQPARAYHEQQSARLKPQMAMAAALTRLGSSRPGHALLVEAARWWPGLIRTAAAKTRIPAWAIA